MRILALTNLYPPHYLGGYELICYMVVNELRARGHQVEVLTSNHTVPGRTEEPGVVVERSLRIHGFYGHPWLGIAPLFKLERHNNEVLRAAIERHKPDLVYVWNMGGLSKSMVLSLQRMGIPCVYYLSDHWIARGFTSDVWLQWWNNPDKGWKHKALRTLLTTTGVRSRCDAVAPTNSPEHLRFQRLYFCSKALRKLTAAAGFEVMHGAVIYAPVDTQRFYGAVKSVESPLQKFVWVGRLAPDKGVMTALKAIKHARSIDPKFSAELHLYGSGDAPYTAELRKFAKAHNLPISFSSAGMEEMPGIYRAYDALLFTSEWAEPFALTPLEAMASGLPVIGTTTGGSREIFRHRDNSLTYTAGNSEELAERILELARDGALRERIARTGQAEVRSTYALPAIVDQIESYLRETLAQWSAPGLPHYSAGVPARSNPASAPA